MWGSQNSGSFGLNLGRRQDSGMSLPDTADLLGSLHSGRDSSGGVSSTNFLSGGLHSSSLMDHASETGLIHGSMTSHSHGQSHSSSSSSSSSSSQATSLSNSAGPAWKTEMQQMIQAQKDSRKTDRHFHRIPAPMQGTSLHGCSLGLLADVALAEHSHLFPPAIGSSDYGLGGSSSLAATGTDNSNGGVIDLMSTKTKTTVPTIKKKSRGRQNKGRQTKSTGQPRTELTAGGRTKHVTVEYEGKHGEIEKVVVLREHVSQVEMPVDGSDPFAENDQTHGKNVYAKGKMCFYCHDESRIFWSFPLRAVKKVTVQHYCEPLKKIVTRTVGVVSKKCSGNHNRDTPCITIVGNARPPIQVPPMAARVLSAQVSTGGTTVIPMSGRKTGIGSDQLAIFAGSGVAPTQTVSSYHDPQKQRYSAELLTPRMEFGINSSSMKRGFASMNSTDGSNHGNTMNVPRLRPRHLEENSFDPSQLNDPLFLKKHSVRTGESSGRRHHSGRRYNRHGEYSGDSSGPPLKKPKVVSFASLPVSAGGVFISKDDSASEYVRRLYEQSRDSLLLGDYSNARSVLNPAALAEVDRLVEMISDEGQGIDNDTESNNHNNNKNDSNISALQSRNASSDSQSSSLSTSSSLNKNHDQNTGFSRNPNAVSFPRAWKLQLGVNLAMLSALSANSRKTYDDAVKLCTDVIGMADKMLSHSLPVVGGGATMSSPSKTANFRKYSTDTSSSSAASSSSSADSTKTVSAMMNHAGFGGPSTISSGSTTSSVRTKITSGVIAIDVQIKDGRLEVYSAMCDARRLRALLLETAGYVAAASTDYRALAMDYCLINMNGKPQSLLTIRELDEMYETLWRLELMKKFESENRMVRVTPDVVQSAVVVTGLGTARRSRLLLPIHSASSLIADSEQTRKDSEMDPPRPSDDIRAETLHSSMIVTSQPPSATPQALSALRHGDSERVEPLELLSGIPVMSKQDSTFGDLQINPLFAQASIEAAQFDRFGRHRSGLFSAGLAAGAASSSAACPTPSGYGHFLSGTRGVSSATMLPLTPKLEATENVNEKNNNNNNTSEEGMKIKGESVKEEEETKTSPTMMKEESSIQKEIESSKIVSSEVVASSALAPLYIDDDGADQSDVNKDAPLPPLSSGHDTTKSMIADGMREYDLISMSVYQCRDLGSFLRLLSQFDLQIFFEREQAMLQDFAIMRLYFAYESRFFDGGNSIPGVLRIFPFPFSATTLLSEQDLIPLRQYCLIPRVVQEYSHQMRNDLRIKAEEEATQQSVDQWDWFLQCTQIPLNLAPDLQMTFPQLKNALLTLFKDSRIEDDPATLVFETHQLSRRCLNGRGVWGPWCRLWLGCLHLGDLLAQKQLFESI